MNRQFIQPAGILTSPATVRVANLRIAEMQAAGDKGLPSELSFNAFVKVMEPFIETTILAGRKSYKVNAASAPPGDFTNAAIASCGLASALPKEEQSDGLGDFNPVSFDTAVDPSCANLARWNTYWWGGSLYLNHCLIQEINNLGGNITSITSVLGAFSFIPGWVLTAVSLFLRAEIAWLVTADNNCKQTGAFLQIPWTLTIFVKQNC